MSYEFIELHSSRLKDLEEHEANIQKIIAERRKRNTEGAPVMEEKNSQEDIDDSTKTVDDNVDENAMDVEKTDKVTEEGEDENTEEKDDDVEMNEV